ncbi:ERF family protein [Bradyrhizobium sp. SZCCHNS2015]|uniref:ERF family protein n=1 Tax=Bradyrhizobium sp. SZCCHNS2015 TaxID=3057305 RepID=UPI0028ED1E3C|nr:ERF family protein [Bradyrhizobium sp. SZCCHNS2015]
MTVIETSTALAERKPRAVRRTPAPVPAAAGPLDIVRAALETGNVDMYREAVALMKEMDAFAARKAFNNALADAKAQLPIIRKNKLVDFENRAGDRTTYWHEDLAQVVDTVAPILSSHGLSHRWRLQGKPGEPVTVTCIISHRDGHHEENTLSAGADTSGGKNPIQGVKSAVSYLERITLMASLGLASKGDDDDGRSTSEQTAPPAAYEPPPGAITEPQADNIRELLDSLRVSKTAFLTWARQKRIEDIPADHYESCVSKIKEVGQQVRK